MRFIIALVVAAILILACAKPLKKYPIPFYLGAIALVVLYWFGTVANMTGGFWSYYMPLMQRCAVAFLLLTVVMFVGVLDDASPLRSHLMPVRRQLSILGCIFAFGHVTYYTASYLPRLASGFGIKVTSSLALAVLLVVLMVVLMITSFQIVKHHMNAASWKKVQRLAYPFYLLIYVHLAILLLPSALSGSTTAVLSMSVYTAVVLLYVVLRTRRATCRKATQVHNLAEGEASAAA